MKTKTCCTCKRALPLASFYKNKGRYDGHSTRCIDCSKAYKQENRESWNKYQREYKKARYKARKKKTVKGEPAAVQNGVKLVREKFYWED